MADGGDARAAHVPPHTHPSHPVTLREAALDSPTFRAAVLHFSEQAEAVERWLDGYVKAASRLAHDVQALEESINSFLSRTSPNPLPADSILDYDYTTLALRRLGEASRGWWVQIIAAARRAESVIAEPLRNVLGNDVRSLNLTRRNLDQAQKTYDTTLARYVAQSKTKEPSSLREDAFTVFETRRAYLKVALEFCVLAPQLRFTLDKLLVRISSDMLREMRRARNAMYPAAPGTDLEMDRIRGWAKEMEASESVFRRGLIEARREIAETALASFKPSRELDDYNTSTVPYIGSRAPPNLVQPDYDVAIPQKQGWLFHKAVSGKPVRTSWIRRWYYCRDGVFGWLVQGPQGGVLQGEEIGVLLCNAKPAVHEERRFCFEVKTKLLSIMLQAETQSQLIEWLEVFEVEKKRAFEASLSYNDVSSPTRGADPAFSITQPPLQEFSARHLDGLWGSEELGLVHDRPGMLPPPTGDTSLVSSSSFDVPRRTLPTIAREDGESGKEHASRIMQKLDIHRKATMSPMGEQAIISSSSGYNVTNIPSGASTVTGQPASTLPTGPQESHGARTINPPQAADGKRGLLAPLTLSRAPCPTHLSKAVVSASGERIHRGDQRAEIPTALLANYWGSSSTKDLAGAPSQITELGGDSVLEDPRRGGTLNATGGTVSLPVSHERSKSEDASRMEYSQPAEPRANETFPGNYPFELRAHHAQFRLLFPAASPQENLVLVFRAAWVTTDKDGTPASGFAGTGRIYATAENLYFYGHQIGLVVAYHVRLDGISEVTAAPGKDCDFIFLHLTDGAVSTGSGYSRITIKVFLEDSNLLHSRLNLLVDDLQAEEPLGASELVNALVNLEKDDQDKRCPSEASWEETSANSPIDDRNISDRSDPGRLLETSIGVRLHGRPVRKTLPKFRLPTHPVTFEPEDMQRKVCERHFEISAKACFHVLFGDKSFVFPKLYFERQAQQITQGPWGSAGLDRRMKRSFRFKAAAVDMLGRSRLADVVDFQTIDIFNDHVTYLVTHTKTPWHLPHSQDFKLLSKVVITHLSKSKCKLAIFTKVDWSKTPAFSRSMVERQALADAGRDAEELADVATDQVRKLGPHGRTKRAIQVYGQVGSQTQVVEFKPDDVDASRKEAIKPRTLTAMIFETARSFAESVASSLVMWAFAGIRTLFSIATAHRLVLGVLVASLAVNVLLTSKDGLGWFKERRAAKFMERIGIGPHAMMSRVLYLSDLDNATLGGVSESWLDRNARNSSCYRTFSILGNFEAADSPFQEEQSAVFSASSQAIGRRLRRSRQRFGSYRHDLVVAMRVVNQVEQEMWRSEWANWLRDETHMCERASGLLNGQETGDRGNVLDRAGESTLPAEEKEELGQVLEWYMDYCKSCDREQETLTHAGSSSGWI